MNCCRPAPDPFLKAAERLGVEPQLCLALEPTDEIRGLCTLVALDLHEVRGLILALEAGRPG